MANRRANVGLAPAALHATNTTPETRDQHGTDSLDIAGLRLSDDATEVRDPVAAALGLPEILEKTLLSLSHENVARMLTVSKHWRQVIHDSIYLRRKLFLTPVQKRPPIKYDADVSCGPHEERLRCRTGITFGAVVEACQRVVDACQKGVETVPDVRIFIFFGGLLAGATEVRVARQAQAQANAQRRT